MNKNRANKMGFVPSLSALFLGGKSMNLYNTSFSVFGAYIGITAPTEDKEVPYLSLKSLHSQSKSQMESMTLMPFDTINQRPLSFHYDACYSHIKMISSASTLSVTFDDESRLVIDGSGSGLQLDTKPLFNFEYNYLLGNKSKPYCIVNCCDMLPPLNITFRNTKCSYLKWGLLVRYT